MATFKTDWTPADAPLSADVNRWETNTEEIKREALAAADGDVQAAIYALEDGQYLLSAGYTDGDQEAIEVAHADLKEQLKN